RRETPTRGRQLTILEQLLGNVGRGQLPRTEEDVPGQRRPD
ncbi:MAG: outer membrane protein assembly factor BamE, partial [Brevundimonas sp.]